ncbi:hypothetical protein AURDEDRAFT_128573 [Auricularia subglabra TFB-10046 SS5]|nr:hypothetical protein AURDEDRAFT_128573 [Auricularia subglabra TFB-10046 SS5]
MYAEQLLVAKRLNQGIQINWQIGFSRWSVERHAELASDHATLMEVAASVEQRWKTTQAVQLASAPETLAPMLTPQSYGLEESMRMLQLSARMYDRGTVERVALEAALAELQRVPRTNSSSRPPSEFSDKVEVLLVDASQLAQARAEEPGEASITTAAAES